MGLILSAVIVWADDPINFEQHVRPIFREHCLLCHNTQQQNGGLVLESYATTMQGGASGEVVYATDLEGSRLWALVNHDEEPFMPPQQDRLSEEKLSILCRWIEAGARERSDSTAPVKKSIPLAMTAVPPLAEDALGPMPQDVPRQPVMTRQVRRAVFSLDASPRAPLWAVAVPHQVLLCASATGELLGVLPFPEGMPSQVRFSRDGRWLLASGGKAAALGTVAIYDVASGARLGLVGEETDSILAADLAPELSSVALGGPSRMVRCHESASGSLRFEIKKHTDWAVAVEFSPDGKWLASADRAGGIVISEARTGREYQVLQGHPAAVTDLSWRRDSMLLASSSEDGSIRIWDVEKVEPVRAWEAHPGGVLSVQFDPSGRLLTAGRDRLTKLWDPTGRLEIGFPAMEDLVLDAAITFDGRFVCAIDWLGNARIWDCATQAPVGVIETLPPRLEARLASAEQALAAQRVLHQQIVARLEDLDQRRASLRSSYENKLSQLVSMRQAWEQARAEKSGQAEPIDLSTQERELAEWERSVGQSAADLFEVEQEHQDLEPQHLQATQQLEEATAACDRVQTELDAFHSRRKDLLEKQYDLERQVADQREELAKAQELLQALDRLEQANREVSELLDGPDPGLPRSEECIPAERERHMERVRLLEQQLAQTEVELSQIAQQVDLMRQAYGE